MGQASSTSTIPTDYTTPPFPSLYNPIDSAPGAAQYLYDTTDVWRFTLIWTVILFEACHLLTALYATATQLRNSKTLTWWWPWIIPIVYLVVGGVEALLAGTIVGYVLGAIFNAGAFRMSTWFPFVWGLINTVTLIISSFSIQGGL